MKRMTLAAAALMLGALSAPPAFSDDRGMRGGATNPPATVADGVEAAVRNITRKAKCLAIDKALLDRGYAAEKGAVQGVYNFRRKVSNSSDATETEYVLTVRVHLYSPPNDDPCIKDGAIDFTHSITNTGTSARLRGTTKMGEFRSFDEMLSKAVEAREKLETMLFPARSGPVLL